MVKDDGTPFKVFTPFSRAWAAHGWARPAPRPKRITWAHDVPGRDLPAAPKVDADLPAPGEEAARRRWEWFRDEALDEYDRMAQRTRR